MRRLIDFVMVMLVGVTLTACGGSDSGTAPTVASVVGTWNLSTVNGAPLPFTIQVANPKIEILNEQLNVATGGTFTQTGIVRINGGASPNQAYSDAGSWTLNGTAATFLFNSDGSSGTGTVSGNSFTVTSPGVSWVYVKQ